MKHIIMVMVMCAVGTGCMFVNKSYGPAENGLGYEISGTCVGYNWDDCIRRAEDLCAEVGQKVSNRSLTGGPDNNGKIAIVPKRISIQCE